MLIPELNLGQLRMFIRAKYLVDAIGLNKVQGKPFCVARSRRRRSASQLGLATNGQPADEGTDAAVAELAGAADEAGG